MYKIKCGEIWGGIHGADLEAETSGLQVSLFSSAAEGGKGGDIYYLSVCNSDQVTRIAIADVVGHGDVVSNTSSYMYDLLADYMDSDKNNEILSQLNIKAVDRGYKAITTASVNTFYRDKREFYFANAGHSPVLMRNNKDEEWQELTLPNLGKSNLPLGVDIELDYEQEAVHIKQGTQLLLYTDGFVEARDSAGNQFGETRLKETINNINGSTTEVKQGLHQALSNYTGNRFNHDDVTFMVAEIN